MTEKPTHHIQAAIIGGGPAGLMAAETLLAQGIKTALYEAMPSVGRKFLVAGKGGLNLTHAERFDDFLSRYDTSALMPHLKKFGPAEMRSWMTDLGYETFEGTSGRVFPKNMNAGEILHTWRERLREAGLTIHTHAQWLGWGDDRSLAFDTPDGAQSVQADTVILALGGASWPQLGANGDWVDLLKAVGVPISPLRPANCGFDVDWSDHFKTRFNGQPIKPVSLIFAAGDSNIQQKQGEFIATEYGVEGSLIYAFSAPLRDAIEAHGTVEIALDLAPDWTRERLQTKLAQPRGSRSLSSHLKRTVGLHGVKVGLLWEFLSRDVMEDPAALSQGIKALPLTLVRPRPIEEAISTAGGVAFTALDDQLMLKELPGVFCAGEMLDWEAPTGGYLLTASFATGRAAGQGAATWLMSNATK